VTLLVSELVGNAVVHAGSEVELTVRLIADRLRVDVVDHSTNVPHRRDAGEEDLTGRGSELVEILATSWGISGRPDGKSVWFEIALPADLP
jgi:anti-sigma regulatory factor (Ser/Thr protein kinase)